MDESQLKPRRAREDAVERMPTVEEFRRTHEAGGDHAPLEPCRLVPCVLAEELPEEFAPVLKVRIAGWRLEVRRLDGVDWPGLIPEWILMPADWSGEADPAARIRYMSVDDPLDDLEAYEIPSPRDQGASDCQPLIVGTLPSRVGRCAADG